MEKSNSKTSHNLGSGDEGDDRRDDQQPTTSKKDNLSPEEISHNMNDLKALDFNSADEVRQAMKAVLAGKLPPQPFSEEANNFQDTLPGQTQVQNNPGPMRMDDTLQMAKPSTAPEVHKTVQRKVQQNLYRKTRTRSQPNQKMKATSRSRNYRRNYFGSTRLRCFSPTAGTSRGIRKPKVSSMYLGKLSNVVPFRRRWESDTESDAESVVIFY